MGLPLPLAGNFWLTPSMAIRLEYRDIAPQAVQALAGVNAYVDGSSLQPLLRRLIEVRTSQINGCAYCVRVHTRQALALGETQERIDALAGWQVSDLFESGERAALGWTEAVTKITEGDTTDGKFASLRMHVDDREIVDLTWAISTMNAWNRIAVAFQREAGDG